MAVARKLRSTRTPAQKQLGRAPAVVRESKRPAGPVGDTDDYNGMPLDAWKKALAKDVEERFGPTPDDLVPAGEAGW